MENMESICIGNGVQAVMYVLIFVFYIYTHKNKKSQLNLRPGTKYRLIETGE